MKLQEIVNGVKNFRSRRKVLFDKYFDPALFTVAANAAYLYGGNLVLDVVSNNSGEYEGPAMFGAYTGLAVLLDVANKFLFLPVARKIKDRHNKKAIVAKQVGAGSFLRTAGQIGALAAAAHLGNVFTTIDDYVWDAKRVVSAFARHVDTGEDLDAVSELEDSLNVNHGMTDFSCGGRDKILSSSKHSTYGKFLRAARWQKTFEKYEKQYGIEKGLLAGTAMRESNGNPLELNWGGDGGAGVMMFQPGTAKGYGLLVFGNSTATGIDRNHGAKLKALVKKLNWNYDALRAKDERFDVDKSVEAAARLLKDNYQRWDKNWDNAVSAYNRGQPADSPRLTSHVRAVRKYQKYYIRHIKNCGARGK